MTEKKGGTGITEMLSLKARQISQGLRVMDGIQTSPRHAEKRKREKEEAHSEEKEGFALRGGLEMEAWALNGYG